MKIRSIKCCYRNICGVHEDSCLELLLVLSALVNLEANNYSKMITVVSKTCK